MQEKTLEELANEVRERIVKECWHKTETGHALDLTGTRELIVEALEKAREEGRKEEFNKICNSEKRFVESVITRYKEELKGKLPEEITAKDWGALAVINPKDKDWIEGFNECLSEIKKLII